MPRGRSRFPRAGGGSRRRTSWITGPETVLTTVTAEGSVLWSAGTIGADGETIIRVRGELQAMMTAAGSAGINGFGAVAHGLAITTSKAFAQGAIGVPNPLDDQDWEGWLWHQYSSLFGDDAFVYPSNEGPGSQRYVIDSKAMRKWNEDMVLFGISAFDDEEGAATVEFVARTRVLVKLP